MTKYILKRLLHAIFSIIVVVAIVMVLIYSCLDRMLIFAQDQTYQKQQNNAKVIYTMRKWQDYGYLTYVNYNDYINHLARTGEISQEQLEEAVKLGAKPENDSELVAEFVERFTKEYESQGYTVERLNAKMARRKLAAGGQQQLYAHKDRPLIQRLLSYFGGIVTIDTIHYVNEEIDIGERGLTFTLNDPLYGGKFSPAIIGNGTRHKYLLYFDDHFPYLHQNLITINLGKSYSVNTGEDVVDTMTSSQGAYINRFTTFPTGLQEQSADDLHTAKYMEGSLASSEVLSKRFTDDYTNVMTHKTGMSRIGYSFCIGILASALAYLLGVPIGIFMARHKDGLVDKLGTAYIVFIIAVPSLAYIFLFKAVGGAVFGLPTTFDMNTTSKAMYILPIVSLALPSVGNLMKWLRRYMIDQMNSDYVKFARSGGLSENEIFFKHIAKNAAIPLFHGIPSTIIFSMTGAIITERVYVVPGTGNLLTYAINAYDNGVIVGVTMFYAMLSVVSIILGDILMSIMDPRISFTSESR